MAKEIRRNNWSSFCKKFNSANQYRPTTVSVMTNKGNDSMRLMSPFMGVALSKKGRLIDGVQIFAARPNPEKVAEPIMTIKQPEKIVLETSPNGADSTLRIRSKDGTEARIELSGEKQREQTKSLVREMAYSLFERRGYVIGNDIGDWYEAEKRVRRAESELTK